MGAASSQLEASKNAIGQLRARVNRLIGTSTTVNTEDDFDISHLVDEMNQLYAHCSALSVYFLLPFTKFEHTEAF